MALAIRQNASLRELTTLRMGGQAACEVIVHSDDDLNALGAFLSDESFRPFVLGKGSNLLAGPDVSDVALIRVLSSAAPHRIEEVEKRLVFRAGAGLKLPALLGWSQKAGLKGLESLTGIPGTVGGAVAMNAGSYGTEIGDLVTRVRIWTPDGGLEWVEARDCTWGYRHFSTGRAGRCLIWEVEMVLEESSQSSVKRRMRKIIRKKKDTQPVTACTAGCIFKNPDGDSAGRLLDKAGFRGRTLGGCRFSDIHANFLENTGNGTAEQALELIDTARRAVTERFGVNLETEVITL